MWRGFIYVSLNKIIFNIEWEDKPNLEFLSLKDHRKKERISSVQGSPSSVKLSDSSDFGLEYSGFFGKVP